VSDERGDQGSRRRAWDRRTRQRTPKVERVISAIKVMDPTHPLFGKTLRLLSEQCGRGKAFVAVAIEDGRRRLIPRTATDLDSQKHHSSPLSLISARSLLPLARHIQCCLSSFNSKASHENGSPSEASSSKRKSRTPSASAGSAVTGSPKSARSADRHDTAAYSRRGPRSC
jgi:hypothetical protein